MFGVLDSSVRMACESKLQASAIAGMVVCVAKLDKLIPKLPPFVHYALAGYLVDAVCRGARFDTEAVGSMAMSNLGASAYKEVYQG